MTLPCVVRVTLLNPSLHPVRVERQRLSVASYLATLVNARRSRTQGVRLERQRLRSRR